MTLPEMFMHTQGKMHGKQGFLLTERARFQKPPSTDFTIRLIGQGFITCAYKTTTKNKNTSKANGQVWLHIRTTWYFFKCQLLGTQPQAIKSEAESKDPQPVTNVNKTKNWGWVISCPKRRKGEGKRQSRRKGQNG